MNILTPYGYKDINDISIGDDVLAFDTYTGEPIVNQLLDKKLINESVYNPPIITINDTQFSVTDTVIKNGVSIYVHEVSIGDTIKYSLDSNEVIVESFDIIDGEYVKPNGDFIYYRINNLFNVFKYQSVWVNNNVSHGYQLNVGDVMYDENDQDVIIETIEEINDINSWWHLTISGDHSFISDNIIFHNASRYLVAGGTGNWNSTTNWSATNGGASGASFPVSTDDVFSTSLSGSGTLNVNVGSACLTFNSTGSTNTFNFQNTLTVVGSVTWGVGISFSNTSGSPLLVIGSTSTLTSNGITFPYELALRGSTPTHTFADNWTVGHLSFNSGSSLMTILGNKTINVSGNFTEQMSGTKLATGTTLVLAGTGTWSNTSSGVLRANLTINTAGTITISTSVRITDGTLTYIAGTVNHTAGGLIIGGVAATSLTINTNGIVWKDLLTTQNGLTHNLTSDLTFNGTLYGGGSITATFNTSNGSKIICNNGTVALVGGCALQGSAKLEIIGVSTWDGTNSGRVAMDVDVNCTSLNFIGGTCKWGGAGKTFKWVSGTPLGNFDLSIISTTGNLILDLNGTTVRNFVGSVNASAFSASLASEMKVSGQFYLNTVATTTNANLYNSTSAGVQRKITLLQGCAMDVGFGINFTDIDAGDGKTLCAYKATITNCNNVRTLPLEVQTIGIAN